MPAATETRATPWTPFNGLGANVADVRLVTKASAYGWESRWEMRGPTGEVKAAPWSRCAPVWPKNATREENA